MKFSIKIFLLVSFSFLLNACHKHEEGDGHDHGQKTAKTETKEEEHTEEANATIASLTQEQIATVGITYGNIEMKELTATIKANGKLRVPNDKKANATSLYGGAVQTIRVQVGDHVRKGDVIATIANPQFVQLQEEYLTTASRITFAEQEYNRQKELFDNKAGAKKNLQNAEAELKTLRTKRVSLQKQIQLMGINPSSISNNSLRSGLAVTAPISGTISSLSAQIGSYVDVSSPVAEIVDNASLHLDLNVFEKDLPQLKVGQIIHFNLTNNPTTEYDAKIFSIGASFEDESKTIPVHAEVTGNKKGLIDGMNITSVVSLSNATTTAVASDAIVEADGKYFIFIITNKKPNEDHEHKEGEVHDDEEADKQEETKVNFEKVEVVKGISNMGFTAITPVNEIPKEAKVVTKGAFFINAKLSNTGGHQH